MTEIRAGSSRIVVAARLSADGGIFAQWDTTVTSIPPNGISVDGSLRVFEIGPHGTRDYSITNPANNIPITGRIILSVIGDEVTVTLGDIVFCRHTLDDPTEIDGMGAGVGGQDVRGIGHPAISRVHRFHVVTGLSDGELSGEPCEAIEALMPDGDFEAQNPTLTGIALTAFATMPTGQLRSIPTTSGTRVLITRL